MAVSKKKPVNAQKQVASLVVRAIGGSLAYRYNEAIADGFLPCAPETVQGGLRPLEYIDIIGAAIFFRFLAMGLQSRVAGKYTCLAVGVMRRSAKPDGTPKIFKVAILLNAGKEPTARGIASFNDLQEIENETVITFDLTAIGAKVKVVLDEVL
ncbi:hypothetical protein [Tardiphaga sp. vice278]|uniref:hypothetical protein n=1 Tax=Tardiphaga sp. vice278 TaxID=2592815 RepID=UPI00116258A8|nr:hypothetical protein [Tardiphaga sp. vice278]QDM19233.1 hypothetical protein FNL53_27360 [Tardiphaga sp. vice278]